MSLLGIGELARKLEVDPKTLRNCVERGLMTRRDDGLFDYDTALHEWQNNVRHEVGHKRLNVAQMPAPSEGIDSEIRQTRSTDYAKARAAVQLYDARLKKLRYEKQAGTLTPTRDVADAAHRTFRIIRDEILAVPSRISAQLAAEPDEHRCYQLLENALHDALQNFSEGRVQ